MSPILIELTRGVLVESVHRGAVAIVDAQGRTVLALGDTSRIVYPRSAIKALQAIPLIESGAADRFGFGRPEIALACASHHGTERHTRLAAKMLRKAGLEERDLGCGPHQPMGEAAAADLIRRGGHPTRLENNCSGKHAGMVATCVHTEAPTAGYTDPEHPVQVAIRQRLAAIVGFAYGPQTCGIDGCSAPNWASPLQNLAHAFALIGTRTGAAAPHAAALERILDACWAEPELVQGPGGLDSRVLTTLKGRVYMKTGAEGVDCATVPALGLGIALKIDDGAGRASQAVVMEILARLVPDAADLVPPAVIKDFNGRPAGERRMSADLAQALEGMKVKGGLSLVVNLSAASPEGASARHEHLSGVCAGSCVPPRGIPHA